LTERTVSRKLAEVLRFPASVDVTVMVVVPLWFKLG